MNRVSPWVGAKTFDEQDRGRFFGRQHEIRELVDRWRRNRLTILAGEAGVGKTSLLRAGVVRRLNDDGVRVLPIGDVGDGTVPRPPAPAVADCNPYVMGLLLSWQRNEPPHSGSLGMVEFLRCQEQYGPAGAAVPTLVAVDQFHHVLSGPERREFLEELAKAAAAAPNVHLLVSVRIAELADLGPVRDVLGHTDPYVLGPLDRDGALDAVVLPTVGSAVGFASGVAGRLVDALAEPAVEPLLLQITLQALWGELSPEDATISAGQLPEPELALAAYCVPVLDGITGEHGMQTCEVGTWMRRTFVDAGDGARTVSQAAARAEMPDSVLRALENRYLIKVGETGFDLRFPLMARALRRILDVREPVVPPDPQDSLMAARLAMSADDLPMATRHAQAALRSGGPERRISAEARSLLGDIAFHRRQLEDAEEHYRVAAEEYAYVGDLPQTGRLLAAIGRLLLEQGDHQGAMEKLSTAAYRAPADPLVQIGLARAFWATGSTQSALTALDDVLRQSGPGNVEARRLRGELRADLGQAQPALDDLAHVDGRAPAAQRAARMLALAMHAGGGPGDLLEELDEIVASAPRSGPVLLRAARAWVLFGDAAQAAELAVRARAAADPPLPGHQQALVETLITGQ
ncbi:ATP-binding protein [Actinomadura macra]|uniref:ATP-binding protein n=1 Tax=Actinomadura macra TaxID=46164 RepID=UPI00083290D8|nr:ATP-binding protein [Actinomadura macra]